MTRAFAGLLVPLLAACAVLDPEPPGSAAIAPGLSMRLPPPSSLGREVDAVQLVGLRHGDARFAFEARISVTAERILLVGLDPAGRRAMTLQWNGNALLTDVAPWVPSTLRPAAMLADIVMIFWPQAVVAASLAPSGAELTGDLARRVLSVGERTLSEVRYLEGAVGSWSARVSYRNHGWGYDLEIQSREVGGS